MSGLRQMGGERVRPEAVLETLVGRIHGYAAPNVQSSGAKELGLAIVRLIESKPNRHTEHESLEVITRMLGRLCSANDSMQQALMRTVRTGHMIIVIDEPMLVSLGNILEESIENRYPQADPKLKGRARDALTSALITFIACGPQTPERAMSMDTIRNAKAELIESNKEGMRVSGKIKKMRNSRRREAMGLPRRRP